MFSLDAISFEELEKLIESDLPDVLWGAGKCPCGDPAGDFAARITSRDYAAGMYAITPAGLVEMTSGWVVGAHGKTAVEALSKAYGLALEKVK